jgi:hypothetical protein
MPLITPSLNTSIRDVPRVIWSGIASGDTFDAFTLCQQYGLAASVQITGTFSGATVTMQVSNDGTNWVTARDLSYTAVSLTATGYVELTLSAAYIRPSIASGTATGLSVIMVLRGSHGV